MERKFIDIKPFYSNVPYDMGDYIIYKKVLTQEEFDVMNQPHTICYDHINSFEIGKEYLILGMKDGSAMMTDHPHELATNQKFLNAASGDVLIFGLGLGLIIFPLLHSEDIKSITIIEKDPHLPHVVGEIIKEHDVHNKVKIEYGDATLMHNNMDPNKKYDTIYFDIWPNIDAESIKQMEIFHALYRPFLRDENSYIDSWCYERKKIFYEN